MDHPTRKAFVFWKRLATRLHFSREASLYHDVFPHPMSIAAKSLPLAFIAVLLIIVALFPQRSAGDGEADPGIENLPSIPQPEKRYPRLDSSLAARAEAAAQKSTIGRSRSGPLAAEAAVEKVRVIIEAEPGERVRAVAAAEAAGGQVEITYGDSVQAIVPVSALTALANGSGVRFARTPGRPVEDVTTEGLFGIGVNYWHSANFKGQGSKIAVVDTGFKGYQALLGTELPSNAILKSFRADQDIQAGSAHGAGVAEIIYDIAPAAQLYLVNFDTPVELGNAVDWLIAQDVDIISHSIGWFGVGSGDGTGPINDIVKKAADAGILWVNSAGNSAQKHWGGSWLDANADGWLEFQGSDGGQTFTAAAGSRVEAILTWDDPWGLSSNDYDLYLVNSANGAVVASSIDRQDGNDEPDEELSYDVPAAGTYYLGIRKFSASKVSRFRLFNMNHGIEYPVAAGSIGVPADSPNALAVGAVRWNYPMTLEYYSAQGPTMDGRPKPDLVAPTGVSTVSYYPQHFYGTSAAAPHVSAVAALVKQMNPGWTPAQIRSFLEGRAIDVGVPGKDNEFGAGRLNLGAVPPVVSRVYVTTTGKDNTPTFIWSDVIGATYFEVRIDSADWINVGHELAYTWGTALSEGSHIIQVRAFDSTGMTGGPASLEILVDTIPPTAPTNLAKSTPDTDNTPAFTWIAATDVGSGIDHYEVRMDSGAWINIGSVTSYSWTNALLGGSHTLELRAVDKAGNEGKASITFNLEAVGSISGHVYQADGVTPLSGAMVSASPVAAAPPPWPLPLGLTGSDGKYGIGSLPPGQYRLKAQVEGYLSEFYREAIAVEQATLVSVATAQDVPNVDFTLDLGGTISGFVYEADGKTPIAGVSVYASRVGDASGRSSNTGSDGRFTIRGLPTGDYRVRADARWMGYVMEYWDNAIADSDAAAVSLVAPQEIPDIKFILELGGSISGHVYQADGVTPIQGAIVCAVPLPASARVPEIFPVQEVMGSDGGVAIVPVLPSGGSAGTAADGSYTIRGLPTANYEVYAYGTGFPEYVKEYYNGVYDQKGATRVSVTIPSSTLDIDFSLAPNTAPVVSNVVASQTSVAGTVTVTYDVADVEQTSVSVSIQYWTGNTWVNATVTGAVGSVSPGTGKAATWNAVGDFPGQYRTDAKVRVIANDGQSTNHTGSAESAAFTLDTRPSVVFPDANLEAAIRGALGKPTGDLTTADMAGLTKLIAIQKHISDLTGLEYCTNLTDLELSENHIEDISPITSLTKLTRLVIRGNQISDISPLSSLSKLDSLHIGWNPISNISPLSSLTSLTWLAVVWNQVSDISPLAPLANLFWLNLEHNQISDTSPLASLTGLTSLQLQFNLILDIKPLVDNVGIGSGDRIYLNHNPLSATSLNTYIPQLIARGASIEWSNTPPTVTSITASQTPGTGTVSIGYSVADSEQWSVSVGVQYWNGSMWVNATSVTGAVGKVDVGVGKSVTWNVATDLPGQYRTDMKIKVVADDGHILNPFGSGESAAFTLDTKAPSGYGPTSPAVGATGVSLTPALTVSGATEDSGPVQYEFRIGQDSGLAQGVQESGWQPGTTWSPATLSGGTQYWWQVRAKDSFGNQGATTPPASFTTVPPEQWKVDMGITTAPGTGSVTMGNLTFGARDGATNAFSASEGDAVAPPDPQEGVNAYFSYSGNVSTPVDTRKLAKSVVAPANSVTWDLVVKTVGGQNAQMTITWDVSQVLAKYVTLQLLDASGAVLTNMKAANSYQFSVVPEQQYDFKVRASESVTFSLQLKAGWNLISLPVQPSVATPSVLLPDVIQLYEWNAEQKSYTVPTQLVPGKGYWALVFSDVTQTISGTPVSQYQLNGVAGWHLVGSLSVDGKIVVNTGTVWDQFYGWDAASKSYQVGSTLSPGKGYWVLGFTQFTASAAPKP